MKKKLFCLFGCLTMTIALTGAVSNDVTAKALNHVEVERGTGCFVRDANADYTWDPSCNRQAVITYDEEGTIIKYRYQDQGTLPEGAARPPQAIHESYFAMINGLGNTLITETITPRSGPLLCPIG